jgi:hypothetical protein
MSLFDHLVGAREQRGWYGKAQRLAFLRLITGPERKHFEFPRIARLADLQPTN